MYTNYVFLHLRPSLHYTFHVYAYVYLSTKYLLMVWWWWWLWSHVLARTSYDPSNRQAATATPRGGRAWGCALKCGLVCTRSRNLMRENAKTWTQHTHAHTHRDICRRVNIKKTTWRKPVGARCGFGLLYCTYTCVFCAYTCENTRIRAHRTQTCVCTQATVTHTNHT